uniref:Uncharacterized protein n=1 Tax=Panagrolaimus sp. ES5 TaxID=591445 RepID=A0AC34G8W5_9BILA
MVFPHCETNLRDPATFIDCTKGVKDVSVLYDKLENFPREVVIDPMHSVYRGPFEDDLKKLIKGFRVDPSERLLIKFSETAKEKIELLLSKIKFPCEYQRLKIRSLNAFSNYKASELKLFCLYIVPTLLPYIASLETDQKLSPYIESMMIYTSAIRLLVQSRVNNDEINAAETILNFWHQNRQALWGIKAMTFKAHENLHLANQVRIHGPLSTHSAFAGESAIGQIGKFISCYRMEVSVKQIAERLSLKQASRGWLDKNGSPDVKRYFNFNVTQSEKKVSDPAAEVLTFLYHREMDSNKLYGSISISGFTICPFLDSGSTDCFIAVHTQYGVKPIKIMAIVQDGANGIMFCGFPLKASPYSEIINGSGFLGSQPLAYQNCFFGVKDDFLENELMLCSINDFRAKYVLIEVFQMNYLIVMPHPYEHN